MLLVNFRLERFSLSVQVVYDHGCYIDMQLKELPIGLYRENIVEIIKCAGCFSLEVMTSSLFTEISLSDNCVIGYFNGVSFCTA